MRLERLAINKHSSLLQKSVNYGGKKFYSTGPCSIKYNLNSYGGILTLEKFSFYAKNVGGSRHCLCVTQGAQAGCHSLIKDFLKQLELVKY
jgi:hypothetical protein